MGKIHQTSNLKGSKCPFINNCITPTKYKKVMTQFINSVCMTDQYKKCTHYMSLMADLEGKIRLTLKSNWHNTQKRGIFIDVGAFIGQYSISFVDIFQEIYAIEPHPLNYKQLVENTRKFDNIIPLNVAISDKCGTAPLYISKDPEQHSLIPYEQLEVEDFKKNRTGEFILVPTITLPKLLELFGIDAVRLIKLDTEGMELRILKSSVSVMEIVNAWLVEYHKDSDYNEITKLLSENGYDINKFDPYYILAVRE